MIKVNMNSNGTNQYWVPPKISVRKIHHFCNIPAIDAEPESNHEETSDRPKLKDTLQSCWPVMFESVNLLKVKEGPKNCSRLKDSKRYNN